MRKFLETCWCASPPPPPTPAQQMPCSPPPPPPPMYHAPPTPPYSTSQPNTPPGQTPSQTFTPPPSQPVTPPSQPIGPPLSPPTHVPPPPNYYSPPNISEGPPYSPFTHPLTPYTPNTTAPQSTHHHRTIIITACSVGGFFFLAFLLATLLCCKKRYRKHDEERETVQTVGALGTAEVVGSSVQVHEADGQVQEEVNKGKKKVNDHVEACRPQHKLMVSEFNRDSTSEAPPLELNEYARGVFEEFGPKFLRDQLQEQPLEPTAARLVRDHLACGTSATHLLSKIKDVEAIQSGEAPPEKKTLLSEKAPLEEEEEEEEEEEKKLKEKKKQHNKRMSEMVKHDALVDPEGRVHESGSVLPNLTNMDLKNPWRGDLPLFDEKATFPKGEEDKGPHEDKQKPVHCGEERQEIKDSKAIQYGEGPHGGTKKLQNEKKTRLSKKTALKEEKKLKEGQKQHKIQMSEMVKHHAPVDPEGRVFESSSALPNLTNLALKNPLMGNWPLSDENA